MERVLIMFANPAIKFILLGIVIGFAAQYILQRACKLYKQMMQKWPASAVCPALKAKPDSEEAIQPSVSSTVSSRVEVPAIKSTPLKEPFVVPNAIQAADTLQAPIIPEMLDPECVVEEDNLEDSNDLPAKDITEN